MCSLAPRHLFPSFPLSPLSSLSLCLAATHIVQQLQTENAALPVAQWAWPAVLSHLPSSLPAAIAPQLLLLLLLPVAVAAAAAVLLLQIAAGNHSACCMQINASTSDCNAGEQCQGGTHSYMLISLSLTHTLSLSRTLFHSFFPFLTASFYEHGRSKADLREEAVNRQRGSKGLSAEVSGGLSAEVSSGLRD